MVTKRGKKTLYIPGSILDRLSLLTPKQNRAYQALRDEGKTIKEALEIVRPQQEEPCDICNWREEPDVRCRKCRGTGRMPLQQQQQLVTVTNWEKDIIK